MFDFLQSVPLFQSVSPEATMAFGKKLSLHLKAGDVLCLEGDLGSGKTTFAKGLISSLTTLSEETIQSPTFVYLTMYDTPCFSLCHFDLYRIDTPDDFQRLGFLDYFDGTHVCLIEWPHKASRFIPKEAFHLRISHINATERAIALTTWDTAVCH
jgi:tRNA threonylcarbamoyladenosine biosynthesis protein TsaE